MSTESDHASANSYRRDAEPFFTLWAPSFLIFIASGISTFGLNWWLAHSPGGAGLLGVTVGVANMAPLIVVLALAGAVDRSDKRRFLLRVNVTLAGACGLLLLLYVSGGTRAPLLALAALVYVAIESVTAVYFAGMETALADLAPAEWPSSKTASMLQVQQPVSRLAAPLVGGALLAAGLLWALPVVSLAAVAITSLVVLLWGRALPGGRDTSRKQDTSGQFRAALRQPLADAREAAMWVRQQPLLIFMLAVGILLNLVVFPFYSLLPAFLAEVGLVDQAAVYGASSSAYGAGLLLTTLVFISLRSRVRIPRPALVVSAFVVALVAVFAGLSVVREPLKIVVSMGLAGMLFAMVVAVAGGVWLDLTPGEVRARVFSLRRLVAFASIPIGTSLMGLVGSAVGVIPVLRILLVIVLVGLTAAWMALGVSRHDLAAQRVRREPAAAP